MRRHNPSRKGGENSFWQSYADIMASLLLVFILVMTGAILQIMVEYEKDKAELDRATAIAESIAAENEKMAEELEKIVGIRLEIVEALIEEFSKGDMKGKVTIDPQTGAVVFESKLLFDFGKDMLKDEGKDFLKSFMPRYIEILLSDRFKEYVAEIIIEGHTDPVSGYLYNLQLSQKRAYQVAEYILAPNTIFTMEELDLIRPYVTVNGRSESEVIKDAGGNIDAEASRRVELQFRLTEQEMIELMNDVVSGEE